MSTRRTFLRTLAATPLVSLATIDGAAVSAPADAAVIAQAELVRALVAAQRNAGNRLAKIEAVVASQAGPRPEFDPAALTASFREVLDAFPDLTPEAARATQTWRRNTETRMRNAVTAWQDERARLEAAFCMPAAEEAYCQACDRAFAAIAALGDLNATSLPGLIAKAQAVAALPPVDEGEHLSPCEDGLVRSVIRDLAALAPTEVAA